jgi:hypothetical protein
MRNMEVFKRLPRFRYHLSSLLALMLVIAVAAASYGNYLRKIQRQQEAFKQIADKGGWILNYDSGTSIGFGLPPWKCAGGFLCGTGLRSVYEPMSGATNFFDHDMHLFDDILRFQTVDFTGTQVSADGQNRFSKSHAQCRVTP